MKVLSSIESKLKGTYVDPSTGGMLTMGMAEGIVLGCASSAAKHLVQQHLLAAGGGGWVVHAEEAPPKAPVPSPGTRKEA